MHGQNHIKFDNRNVWTKEETEDSSPYKMKPLKYTHEIWSWHKGFAEDSGLMSQAFQ